MYYLSVSIYRERYTCTHTHTYTETETEIVRNWNRLKQRSMEPFKALSARIIGLLSSQKQEMNGTEKYQARVTPFDTKEKCSH